MSTQQRGELGTWEGEAVCVIRDVDRMPPFFCAVPSEGDVWLFASSRGGLTGGRSNADQSVFPYETVDRIYDGHRVSGPATLLRVQREGKTSIVEPLASDDPRPGVRRHLMKTQIGNAIAFEEEDSEAGIRFSYRWQGCQSLGLVRRCTLTNTASTAIEVDVADGLRNLQPFGVHASLAQGSSCLVDAYKQAEIDADSGLGIVSLTAAILDRAEAGEVLRATAAWSTGLDGAACVDDPREALREGQDPEGQLLRRGQRCHYFRRGQLQLAPGESARWWVVVDAGRSHRDLVALRRRLLAGISGEEIEAELAAASEALSALVEASDGHQRTGDSVTDVHHFANTMFNIMRGGIPVDGHRIPADDFATFLRARNRIVAEKHGAWLASRKDESVGELLEAARAQGDADLERLAYEYLPLGFGRRHGDPSRPWNRFNIQTETKDGERVLSYEGNWRDIFQNWEALALSYPGFLESMIAKFVNASTQDGFNPYRVHRDGIDWEVPEPDNPWATIGYWGDHQIVYLTRLLELSMAQQPGRLEALLDREVFSFADVPYRIASYEDLLADPRHTISFDAERNELTEKRSGRIGGDGRFVATEDDQILMVGLGEKLLIPVLAKIANLVPGGGIWMNTQRPEWNDANNALVGLGVSTVTACQLRRHVALLRGLFAAGPETLSLSASVASCFDAMRNALDELAPLFAQESIADQDRRRVLDALAQPFERYRESVYASDALAPAPRSREELVGFCDAALIGLKQTIRLAHRPDGLYDAYVLLQRHADGSLGLERLAPMLEGQVNVLASGSLTPAEGLALIDELFASDLYREDQHSFTLYPVADRPLFLDKNRVSASEARAIPVLAELIEKNDGRILSIDAEGEARFSAEFMNAADLEGALDTVDAKPADRAATLALFESCFEHDRFTGRSGTMYGYEGIGCIYWHMVAKLLLAVQELQRRARGEGADEQLQARLRQRYADVRAGLGFEKSAESYGAFPTDPYSHTPGHSGAQQPGMTGQVKEEILTRFGELGVQWESGELRFAPLFLRAGDFSHDGELSFSVAGVPLRYRRGRQPGIEVSGRDGVSEVIRGSLLPRTWSRRLLERQGAIAEIVVTLSDDGLSSS